MRYISEDGKVFETEWECLAHEKALAEEETKKKKAEEEKKARFNELVKKQKELDELHMAYLKDYCGIDIKLSTINDDDIYRFMYDFPYGLFRK